MVASRDGVEVTSPRRFRLLHELLKAFDGWFFTRVRSRMRKPYFHVSIPLLAQGCRRVICESPHAEATARSACGELVIAPSRHSEAKGRSQET
jgi:hypothetical protein